MTGNDPELKQVFYETLEDKGLMPLHVQPSCSGNSDSNMDYYENNAKFFVESTLMLDMQPLYQRFLPLLPEQAHILDAGCGSGRDAKYFLEQGYNVTAFDASAKIAALAEKEIGQPVLVQRLQDIQYQNQFDGIWACASLLHVPAKELADVLHRLAQALKPQGVIYCSFKYGQGEYEKHGRRFRDMDKVAPRCSKWVIRLKSAVFYAERGRDHGSGVICGSTGVTKPLVCLWFGLFIGQKEAGYQD